MDNISCFQNVLSAEEVITDSVRIQSYTLDWRQRYRGNCCGVLKPHSVESVQKIMQVANANNIAVTLQGGNTSLCGASIPSIKNSIIISLECLTQVRSFNPLDKTITVESGMILANLHSWVAKEGYYFPLSLASDGLCQIGGTIACNAGGANVLRYGTMRDLVLGLEVVLPNGELISHLSSLHKNTTGLDTKQIWIGSEGTLGIITAATLKIFTPAQKKITLLVACESVSEVLLLLQRLQYRYVHELSSFEYMNSNVFELSQKFSGISFNLVGNEFVLCELSLINADDFHQDTYLDQFLAFGFTNVCVASSNKEAQAMWQVRNNISDAQKNCFGCSLKHDIAVPISQLEAFIDATEIKIKSQFPDAMIWLFGHFGDGSLHYDIALQRDSTQGVYQFEQEINHLVYQAVIHYAGTIAAEHGIGQLKRKWLSWMRSEAEIRIMKQLKDSIDPHHIMNPGKILPD